MKKILVLAITAVMTFGVNTSAYAMEPNDQSVEADAEMFRPVEEYSEGFAVAVPTYKAPYRFVFIDESGKRAFDEGYRDARSFSEGLAYVYSGESPADRPCFIDYTGEVVIKLERYSYAGDFKNGLSRVWDGYINRNGENAFPDYYYVSEFVCGKAAARRSSSESIFINYAGENVFGKTFKKADAFYEGLALVQLEDGRYAFIDYEGKQAFGSTFKDAGPFQEGMACVLQDNGFYNYINHDGNIIYHDDAVVFKPYHEYLQTYQPN
jgi:hypothetical protein